MKTIELGLKTGEAMALPASLLPIVLHGQTTIFVARALSLSV